ncbi:hypothetical protein [Bacillus sp. FJAT-47783]|uniref:hypothetical protein n=1 Tax=Bacillus sp. FJAT-47783 TaxID=2922712 RepID=UPI001FAE5F09|nr:hypothetical protein [Bacillus sp. FJAT-47783]
MKMEESYLNKKYPFIQSYSELKYLIHNKSVIDLIDEFENIQSKFKLSSFLIDRFPRKIDSPLFFEWFDVHFLVDGSVEDNKLYFEIENIFLKVTKVLSMYSPIWIETSYGYDPEGIPEEILTEQEKNLLDSIKGKEVLSIQSQEIYDLLLKLSFRGYIRSIIYLPDLEAILSINDLVVEVIAFRDTSIFETICKTEGLYFRKND